MDIVYILLAVAIIIFIILVIVALREYIIYKTVNILFRDLVKTYLDKYIDYDLKLIEDKLETLKSTDFDFSMEVSLIVSETDLFKEGMMKLKNKYNMNVTRTDNYINYTSRIRMTKILDNEESNKTESN